MYPTQLNEGFNLDYLIGGESAIPINVNVSVDPQVISDTREIVYTSAIMISSAIVVGVLVNKLF